MTQRPENGQIELPPKIHLPDNTYLTIVLPDDPPGDAAPDSAFSIPNLAQDIGPEHHLYDHTNNERYSFLEAVEGLTFVARDAGR